MIKKRPPRGVGRRVRSNMGGIDSGLQYALGQIDNQLVVMQQTLSEDRLSSAQYRTHVREVLEEGKERMTSIEHEVHTINNKVDDMKATLDAYDKRLQAVEDRDTEAKGAKRAYGVMGKLAYGAIGAVGTAAGFLLDKITGGGHHP